MPTIRQGVAPNARDQIFRTQKGLIAESYPFSANASTNIPTTGAASGTLVASMVGLRTGDVVTNIVVFCDTVGTNVTFAKLGLLNSSGTFLAATASVSATFNSGGSAFKVVPLTAPYTITADGGYYACFLQFGTIGATIARGNALGGAGVAIGSNPRAYALLTSQTDIAAGTYALADSGVAIWMGVS